MNVKKIYVIINLFIAMVWFVNGLFCKVLNLVPRHEQIIGRILGYEYSRVFAVIIGFSEILMTIWILSGFKKKINTIIQIIVIAVMNILEFYLVPDLLLWSHYNSIFAFIFIIIIYLNGFHQNQK